MILHSALFSRQSCALHIRITVPSHVKKGTTKQTSCLSRGLRSHSLMESRRQHRSNIPDRSVATCQERHPEQPTRQLRTSHHITGDSCAEWELMLQRLRPTRGKGRNCACRAKACALVAECERQVVPLYTVPQGCEQLSLPFRLGWHTRGCR